MSKEEQKMVKMIKQATEDQSVVKQVKIVGSILKNTGLVLKSDLDLGLNKLGQIALILYHQSGTKECIP